LLWWSTPWKRRKIQIFSTSYFSNRPTDTMLLWRYTVTVRQISPLTWDRHVRNLTVLHPDKLWQTLRGHEVVKRTHCRQYTEPPIQTLKPYLSLILFLRLQLRFLSGLPAKMLCASLLSIVYTISIHPYFKICTHYETVHFLIFPTSFHCVPPAIKCSPFLSLYK
jgi:hypothetical protein